MGVSSYRDVCELEYHDDGRPKCRGETRAGAWQRATAGVADAAGYTALPALSVAVARIAQSASRFHGISDTTKRRELLEEAKKLLGAADAFSAANAEVKRIMEEGERTVADIRRYVDVLQTRQGEER